MNYLAPFTSQPGDFSTEGTIDSFSLSMLDDAYKAVNSTPSGWEVLKRPDVPGSNGFMFSEFKDPLVKKTIDTINQKIDSGHSGASYGWTMRNMEAIAKKGWEVYMLNSRLSHLEDALEKTNLTQETKRDLYETKVKLKRLILEAETRFANPVVNLVQQAQTVDSFLNSQVAQDAASNPLAFANAASNDPGMRAMIPDIDQQADAMSRFAEGKMSYAEMRSLCG